MWRRSLFLLVVSAIMSAGPAGERIAVAQGMRPPPPMPTTPTIDLRDPEVIAAGSSLFRRSCTGYCHGPEGRISRAPALRGRDFQPPYLYQRIAGGAPPMPAYQTILPPEEIWKLVAYILSLHDAKD
jgi:mono/diheme cytochrome c family protein